MFIQKIPDLDRGALNLSTNAMTMVYNIERVLGQTRFQIGTGYSGFDGFNQNFQNSLGTISPSDSLHTSTEELEFELLSSVMGEIKIEGQFDETPYENIEITPLSDIPLTLLAPHLVIPMKLNSLDPGAALLSVVMSTLQELEEDVKFVLGEDEPIVYGSIFVSSYNAHGDHVAENTIVHLELNKKFFIGNTLHTLN